jgi:uncharacterized membrane protein YesL
MDWHSFFDPESYAWKPFGYIADIILLSLLWILFSFPVITIGASTTALYDAVAHGFRYKEKDTLSRFMNTFKREFIGSIPSTVLWELILGFGYWLLKRFIAAANPSDSAFVAAVAGLGILIAVAGIACWVFPLLSRFTFSFAALNITAVKLAFSHLLITLAMGISLWLSLYLSVSYIIPLAFLPALLVLFWTFFLEPVFNSYIDNDEA